MVPSTMEVPERFQSPFFKSRVLTTKDCVCKRPKGTIICRDCNYSCKGRLALACPQHPRVVFMYDFVSCPRCYCKEEQLKEV